MREFLFLLRLSIAGCSHFDFDFGRRLSRSQNPEPKVLRELFHAEVVKLDRVVDLEIMDWNNDFCFGILWPRQGSVLSDVS